MSGKKKALFFIVSPCAVVLVFFIAGFIQLNLLSLILSTNPQVIGIQRETKQIVSSLKENTLPPKIVVTEPDKLAFAIATAMAGEENFYSKYILNIIPQVFLLHKNIKEGIFLMDNTLFIVHVRSSELEKISPIIGYLLTSNYFSQRRIKSFPEIKILQKDAYRKYREQFFAEKSSGIDQEIEKIHVAKEKVAAGIAQDDEMITKNKKVIEEALLVKKTKYKTCCSAIHKRLDKEIAIAKKNITDWQTKRGKDTLLFNDYKKYAEFYAKQKVVLEKKKEHISYEQGIFEAEKKITMAFDSSSSCHSRVGGDPEEKEWILVRQAQSLSQNRRPGLRLPLSSHSVLSSWSKDRRPPSSGGMTESACNKEHVITNYLTTLVHEYLHYTSYISKRKKLSSTFFEEGLTEYFARAIMKQTLHVETNVAYPAHVVILREMTKKIPKKEFEEIYFEKDEKRLEAVLDKAYGKDFYSNTQIIFQSLQYTTDSKQAVGLVNEVMERIGAKAVTEGDLLY